MADTLAICDGEGIERVAPQGSPFHWSNGWMFCRGEANEVHIYQSGHLAGNIHLKIAAAEWDSIVRHLDGKLA